MQKYLEIEGRTYYAFEEPDFVGPIRQTACGLMGDDPLPTVVRYDEGELEPRFWRRQFGRVQTPRQIKFDWLFGVFLPAACIFFDPIVFRGWSSEGGILAAYQTFAYLLSGVSIMGLAAWLLWSERLKWLAAPLAGVFFAASAVSGLIGLVLFPFSLLGTIVIVGLLGFTPLFTFITFLRNGRRAMDSAMGLDGAEVLGYVAFLSAGVALVLPWLMNAYVLSTSPRQYMPFW
jgi:hypothetical protein